MRPALCEAARSALTRWPEVTALFADTVTQAIGVLGLAYERGIRVPDELAVAAQADSSLAGFLAPGLTAVPAEAGMNVPGPALRDVR